MIERIEETYRCLLSCRKKMPGMRLEDAFSSSAVKSLEEEHEFVKGQLLKKKAFEKVQSLYKDKDRLVPDQLESIHNYVSFHDAQVIIDMPIDQLELDYDEFLSK